MSLKICNLKRLIHYLEVTKPLLRICGYTVRCTVHFRVDIKKVIFKYFRCCQHLKVFIPEIDTNSHYPQILVKPWSIAMDYVCAILTNLIYSNFSLIHLNPRKFALEQDLYFCCFRELGSIEGKLKGLFCLKHYPSFWLLARLFRQIFYCSLTNNC